VKSNHLFYFVGNSIFLKSRNRKLDKRGPTRHSPTKMPSQERIKAQLRDAIESGNRPACQFALAHSGGYYSKMKLPLITQAYLDIINQGPPPIVIPGELKRCFTTPIKFAFWAFICSSEAGTTEVYRGILCDLVTKYDSGMHKELIPCIESACVYCGLCFSGMPVDERLRDTHRIIHQEHIISILKLLPPSTLRSDFWNSLFQRMRPFFDTVLVWVFRTHIAAGGEKAANASCLRKLLAMIGDAFICLDRPVSFKPFTTVLGLCTDLDGRLQDVPLYLPQRSSLIHHVVHRFHSPGRCMPELLRLLLEAGADPCSVNGDGKTAMDILQQTDMEKTMHHFCYKIKVFSLFWLGGSLGS